MKPQIPIETYKCRPVKVLSNGWILFLISALIIWSGVCLWVLFSPQIKDAINYQKISTCDYVLPSLPGKYCLAWDENKNVFYYDSKIKVFIK